MLHIQTVPDLRLHFNGSPVPGPREYEGRRGRGLSRAAGGAAPRSRVAGLLWSDLGEEDALNNLRFTLSKLRRQLPGADRGDAARDAGLRPRSAAVGGSWRSSTPATATP
jgi:hypothetical protein